MGLISSFVRKTVEDVLSSQMSRYGVQFLQRHGATPSTSRAEMVKRYQSWVYTCTNINAVSVASVPLRVYASRGTGQGRVRNYAARVVDKDVEEWIKRGAASANLPQVKAAQEFEELYDHPSLALFQNINPHENRFEHMELTSTFLDLCGDAFWYVVLGPLGVPQELWVLRSQWVKVVPDPQSFIKGYIYGKSQDQSIRLEPSEVIHFKLPNPNDPWYGMGPLEAAAWAVQRQRFMDQYESSMLRNDGRPTIAVVYKGRINESERQELEHQWNTAYSGPNKAGKVRVMGEDYDVKEFGWSPREMAFLQGRPWTMKEIASSFGVPIGFLDTKEISKAPRSGMEGSDLYHAKYGIRPRCRRIEEKLNERLAPMYDSSGRLFFAFDDPVPQDNEFKLKRTEAQVRNYALTINEWRARDGLEPVPWGDTPLVPLTISPLGDASQQTDGDSQNTYPKVARSGAVAKSVGARSGGSPMPVSWSDMLSGVKADDRARSGGRNPRLSGTERDVVAIINDVWIRQQAEVLRGIKAADPFDVAKWTREVAELIEPALMVNFQRGGSTGLRVLRIELPEWIEAPEVIDALRTESYAFAKKINDTAAGQLSATLQEGVEAGEHIEQLRKRVSDVYDGWRSAHKSEMIARTETARAFSLGEVEAWKQTGVVEVKRWDATGDACPFCLEMNGKEVPVDDAYWKEGDEMSIDWEGARDGQIRLGFGYGDVIGPPLHPNCRCAMVPVVT
jgi:HK97 family phage portal protein